MGGEIDGLVVAFEFGAGEVEGVGAETNGVLNGLAEAGFDAGAEFAGTEGLGDIVVCAEFEPEHLFGFMGFGGEEDDGGVDLAAAEFAADVEAIEFGEHDVE